MFENIKDPIESFGIGVPQRIDGQEEYAKGLDTRLMPRNLSMNEVYLFRHILPHCDERYFAGDF